MRTDNKAKLVRQLELQIKRAQELLQRCAPTTQRVFQGLGEFIETNDLGTLATSRIGSSSSNTTIRLYSQPRRKKQLRGRNWRLIITRSVAGNVRES